MRPSPVATAATRGSGGCAELNIGNQQHFGRLLIAKGDYEFSTEPGLLEATLRDFGLLHPDAPPCEPPCSVAAAREERDFELVAITGAGDDIDI